MFFYSWKNQGIPESISIGSGIFYSPEMENGEKMKKLTLVVFAAIFLLNLNFTCVASASEKEAIAAAQAWLALVDEGKYEESWQEASSLFKRSVKVEQWMSAVQGARETLGKKIKREFSSAEQHTSLPNAPDGNYVVIFFKTSFDKKKEGLETITPMLDKDGTWRVSGYYVR